LTANARLADVAPDGRPFTVNGGGHMMDLFASFPHSLFTAEEVRKHLSLQHVFISVTTVRRSLNHLTEKMAFLEKVSCGMSGTIPVYKYRRAMTERQRERSMLSLRETAIARAVQRSVIKT
jgi:hypothetical protein